MIKIDQFKRRKTTVFGKAEGKDVRKVWITLEVDLGRAGNKL